MDIVPFSDLVNITSLSNSNKETRTFPNFFNKNKEKIDLFYVNASLVRTNIYP